MIVAQLAEVLRDQRVGGRDRGIGHADVLGGEREQRVLEVVAREDRERALGRKAALEQRLADAAHALERLGVGQPPPGAIARPRLARKVRSGACAAQCSRRSVRRAG